MRYAVDGSVKIEKALSFDVVIVGSGLAGLYTALNVETHLTCAILAKEEIDVSNSWLAQGGIAAAVAVDDEPRFHYEDTLTAGAGLCDKDAVRVLVDEAPDEIKRLLAQGVPFDLDDSGDLSITREGGHRKNRVLHAGGDATGRETVKALSHLVAKRPNITFCAHTTFYDILLDENGAVNGAIVTRDGEFVLIQTRNIVIATGGIGQVYRSSTNPPVATGDGIAAAMRAGAEVKSLEFIQFHPTGLWSDKDEGQTFLISEAVRGDGGLLKNSRGERFMLGRHEQSELAPRDIVARGIIRELEKSGETHVFVDITADTREFLEKRFPTIFNKCLSLGIDISRDWIPVAPVQHYLMGGILTDLWGRTSIAGLYACGEAACTGVHGANRLASNSMLECLVFGRRVAEDISKAPVARGGVPQMPEIELRVGAPLKPMEVRHEIQALMSRYGYVVRTPKGLAHALDEVTKILATLETTHSLDPRYLETLNVAMVAKAILTAALARPDSVGSHYIVENIVEEEPPRDEFTVIPYADEYRDDMIFCFLAAKDALGVYAPDGYQRPTLKADLLDVQGSYIDCGDAFFLAVDANDRVVGMLGTQSTSPTDLWLKRLFVKPELKGSGIGTLLLNALESYAAPRGVTTLHTRFAHWYAEAARFYPARGFTYADPVDEYTHHMIKTLH